MFYRVLDDACSSQCIVTILYCSGKERIGWSSKALQIEGSKAGNVLVDFVCMSHTVETLNYLTIRSIAHSFTVKPWYYEVVGTKKKALHQIELHKIEFFWKTIQNHTEIHMHRYSYFKYPFSVIIKSIDAFLC